MSINRFYSFIPQNYNSMYVPYPIEDIQRAGMVKEEQLAQEEALKTSLPDTVAKAIPAITNPDIAYKNQKVKEWSDKVDAVHNQFLSSDPALALPQLKLLSAQIQRDLSQDPHVQAIIDNAPLYKSELDKADKLHLAYVEKGDNPLKGGYYKNNIMNTDSFENGVKKNVQPTPFVTPMNLADEAAQIAKNLGVYTRETNLDKYKLRDGDTVYMNQTTTGQKVYRNGKDISNEVIADIMRSNNAIMESHNINVQLDPSLQNEIEEVADKATRYLDDKTNKNYIGFNSSETKNQEFVPRFETTGIGINPQTLPKSYAELNNKIEIIKDQTNKLAQDLSTIPPGTPEYDKVQASINWNNMLLKKNLELQQKADKLSSTQLTSEQKNLLNKYGEFNPFDLSGNDPNIHRLLDKYNLPSTSTVMELMKAMGSKNPAKDMQELSKAYQFKSSKTDDWLKNNSKNFTVQPTMVTIDSSKDQKISNILSNNVDMRSWQFYDENGPIPEEQRPQRVQFSQVSEEPLDEVGTVYGVAEVDAKGEPTGKHFYASPLGKNNINENVGINIARESTPGSRMYNVGLNLISPEFANQVAMVRSGETQDILHGGKKIGTLSNTKTAHGPVYHLQLDDFEGTKTFGSREEVLQQLNIDAK